MAVRWGVYVEHRGGAEAAARAPLTFMGIFITAVRGVRRRDIARARAFAHRPPFTSNVINPLC